MSIKGKSQELFIGKTEINIRDYQWTYKLKKFRYEDISRIEYCFRTMTDRKSTRLNSSHVKRSRMPSSA